MEEVSIPLRNRSPMTFVGEEVAFVSSRREDSGRWTEMRVYRTEDGAYVYRRTGRSVVYHRPTCEKILGRMDLCLVSEPGDDWYPCEVCIPETDDDRVMVETDKEFARRTADLRQLVYHVQERDRDSGALTLTPMGRQILEVAAERDPGIIEAIRERMLAAAAGE